MAQAIEWDETKAQDKEFLISYYQSRADRWKDVEKAKKTFEHFQKAADDLRREINP